MAYYECTYKDDIIGIGDRFTVALTGSHNLSITATVCYISKATICLLSSNSLGEVSWSNASNYAWNYSANIKGKNILVHVEYLHYNKYILNVLDI